MKKEDALQEYITMIQKSWTYGKMTRQEQNKILEILNHERTQKAIKGATKTRWDILQAIYFTYLEAIGYTGFNWREEKEERK